ncbi:serine/threonine-protein kinase par-1-like [Carassius gibelio]|uniref:serine/threonine-protein kinase par-1-like n=1 Tax=Carassius gibelio TaxID=101364 RepID=UPI002278D157|nr:serine/threonine-protein kinase par-1-like [Carassius gibelio]XP_052459281.1 serine/threonine-protein kinase par-1-like [Carassius gibelio]XP_052459282.1 serine/threonine-protein kinase par-1-like [Carassius gibelio]XP_052459283.1 serine/threonine-protein kinase par-1-like [Carassius gibelio]
MNDLQMHRYSRLSNSRSDSSGTNLSDSGVDTDSSIGTPPSFSQLLKNHGYTIQKELGQRGSRIVFLVHDEEGNPYVIKKIISGNKKEIEIFKSLEHGYIVTYVDLFEDKEAGLFYVVMEYCAGGDLYQRMKAQKERGFFEEHQILDWFVQICLALQYIHERNIIHRDIKPQNIFLTEDGYVNLGDFGCSKGLERADAYAESVVGTELYVSPEVLKNKYKSKSDIWSMGWLLHDLCMLDVWSDVIERRFQHINSMRGNTPQISERYSEELRKLIQEMLSCDPTQRPSADEILAKPFLNNAVKKLSQRIPSGLEERLNQSFKIFDEAYNKHYPNFEALVEEWRVTTDSLEEVHRNCTIGTLSGSVIGAAGGITAVVGAILTPFTFGASLIVTVIGVGVGVAGGVTGAASSITNAVKQKSLRENIQRIQQNFTDVTPLLESLNAVRKVLKTVQKFKDFVSDSSDNVQMSCNVGRSRLVCGTELVHLGLLANIGIIFAQTARVGRAAATAVATVTGVLSGILVIVDTVFIVMDSIDIHQMRQGQVNDQNRVTSSLLKSIAKMRKTHTDLCNVSKEIKETKTELIKYIEVARAYRDLESSNT